MSTRSTIKTKHQKRYFLVLKEMQGNTLSPVPGTKYYYFNDDGKNILYWVFPIDNKKFRSGSSVKTILDAVETGAAREISEAEMVLL